MVDRDLNERACVSNLLIEPLLLCIEIVTITSQLVSTHLYLYNVSDYVSLIGIKSIHVLSR